MLLKLHQHVSIYIIWGVATSKQSWSSGLKPVEFSFRIWCFSESVGLYSLYNEVSCDKRCEFGAISRVSWGNVKLWTFETILSLWQFMLHCSYESYSYKDLISLHGQKYKPGFQYDKIDWNG